MWLAQLVAFLLALKGSSAGFHLVDIHGETVLEEKQGLLLFDGGTVCDGKFFGPTEVYAICREMGFDSDADWRYGSIWPKLQEKYPIKLADVHCLEPYWSLCSYVPTDPVFPKCTHENDVLVTCKGSIISCPPGMYRDHRNCKPCPSNTYKAVEGTQISCSDCPDSASSVPGSSSCSCLAGTFWNGTRCLGCSEGSVSQEGALECLKCPPDSTVINGGQSCSCSSGMTWSWDTNENGSCESCLPGTYKNPRTADCAICPAGTTSATGSENCICKAGTFWNLTNSKCEDCSPGTVSQVGAFKCLSCPLGSADEPGNSSCKCPWAKSWTWHGITGEEGSCKYVSSSTTLLLICVILILAAICFVLGLSLILERRKSRETIARSVAYSRYGGLGVSGDQDALITN